MYCVELPLLLLEGLLKVNPSEATQKSPHAQLVLLGQQFQQSGFLDLLPQLLQDTADQLQAAVAAEAAAAAAAAAAAVAADAVSSSYTGSGPSSSTGSPTQPGNSDQGTAAPQTKLTQQAWVSRQDLLLLTEASQLLQTYTFLSLCYPLGKFAFELVPGCDTAVMQLASISFQHISSLLEYYQMDFYMYNRMQGLWLCADQAARLALAPDTDLSFTRPCIGSVLDSRRGSDLQRYLSTLFDSPHTGQCMAVMLAYAAYAMLLLQRPSLPDLHASSSGNGGGGSSGSSGSSDGGSSSSSSSSNRNAGSNSEDRTQRKLQVPRCSDAVMAWQFACEQHQLLPPTHQALLQQAGLLQQQGSAVCSCWLDSTTGGQV